MEELCVDSARKERRRGVKRGPYSNRKRTEYDGQTDEETEEGEDDSAGSSAGSADWNAGLSEGKGSLQQQMGKGSFKIRIPQQRNQTVVEPETTSRPLRVARGSRDGVQQKTTVSSSPFKSNTAPIVRTFSRDRSYLDALAKVCSDILEEWERADYSAISRAVELVSSSWASEGEVPHGERRTADLAHILRSVTPLEGEEASTSATPHKRYHLPHPSSKLQQPYGEIERQRLQSNQTPLGRDIATPPETPQTPFVVSSTPSPVPTAAAKPIAPKTVNLNQLDILGYLNHFRLAKPPQQDQQP